MLVLTRYEGEAITVGNDVKIKILAVTDKKVTIGVDAPKKIEVHREEVYERLQRKKGNGNNSNR